ncbi:HlyD family secretion protein [bacterium]|nr:HlyD family secretion protein [bacterium]
MSKTPKDIFEQNAKIRLKQRRMRHLKKLVKVRVIVPVIAVAILVLSGAFAFLNSLKYQSTDDAFIEGSLISIAPKVSGQVISLKVNDNDFVKKGQLLLEIDPKDYENKVKELESALKEAKANQSVSSGDTEKSEADLSYSLKNLDFAKRDFERYSKLKQEGLCTKQQYDAAETAYKEALERNNAMNAAVKSSVSKQDAASANIEKIEAQLAQAKLNLSYTKIYAPQDGNVSSRSVEEGNYVNVAQPLMSVVSPNVWVVANYKETQLTHMKKGQEVRIKIDTYPNKKFKGKIDSIQRASGAKASLFPPENAVGSYIKVVQRIPVKIIFDEDISDYTIAPGMSVVPRVKIR